MTIKDIFLLLIGAVLGAMVNPWYGLIATYVATRRRALVGTTRQNESMTGYLEAKTVAYYRAKGRAVSLYVPEHIRSGSPVPLLFDPKFSQPEVVGIREDSLFVCDQLRTDYAVSKRAIRWYRRRGVRLFDGEQLFVKMVKFDVGNDMTIILGRFNYFAYASLHHALRKEIMSRWRRPVLHNKYLRSFSAALAGELQPQGVACVCATLLNGPDGLYVAIANRSTSVLNANNTRAAIPAFGMESNSIGGRVSRYGLTFHNFAREFSEEFFDVQELVDTQDAMRADPDWILQNPAAVAVIKEAKSGRLKLIRAGLAINPSDGSLKCALVAHFTSRRFFRWMQDEMNANWESARSAASSAPIEFIRLDDPCIDDWAYQRGLSPTSIFTLDLARMYATKLRADPKLVQPSTIREADPGGV